MQKYSVFISYRRAGSAVQAELLRQMLLNCGMKETEVFMDTHTLLSGDVKPQIQEAVKHSLNFIVLISDGCCDENKRDDIWLLEINTAKENNKNIIPIFWSEQKMFPEKLSYLSSHNAVSYIHDYSDAFLKKLFMYLLLPINIKWRIQVGTHKRDLCYAFIIAILLFPNILCNTPSIISSKMKQYNNAIQQSNKMKDGIEDSKTLIPTNEKAYQYNKTF